MLKKDQVATVTFPPLLCFKDRVVQSHVTIAGKVQIVVRKTWERPHLSCVDRVTLVDSSDRLPRNVDHRTIDVGATIYLIDTYQISRAGIVKAGDDTPMVGRIDDYLEKRGRSLAILL